MDRTLQAQQRPLAGYRPSPELQAALQYKSALGLWHASLFAATRRGEEFTATRPQLDDFAPGQALAEL